MPSRVTVEGVRAVLLVAVCCGCEGPPSTPLPPDGGPPLALEIQSPPGSQIGLHYGVSTELIVLYRTDDAARRPLAGQPVRFSIFGDPAGSTLSADRALTDAMGLAKVTLTAGAAEATFRVTASALNAPDAE